MKTGQTILSLIFGLLFLAGCKDEYFPTLKPLDQDILVVEGYIDGGDETVITLSKVKGMSSDTSTQKYVTGATVEVEDDKGKTYPLYYDANGDYKGTYSFDPAFTYRVKIKTANQKEYVSRFVPFKVSPAIDSITYHIDPDGARFLVNTHDPAGQSIYYRWKYEETWQYRSSFKTGYIYDGDKIEVVDLEEDIYNCWQSHQSREILLNSSANLREDVMKDIPLLFIPNGSEKLSYIYSLNIRQFVMDSVGYNFFRMLKKNTEETGSIFDPQPGNLKGNVLNVNDPDEMVVGYIGAGKSVVKREFFTIPWNFRPGCAVLINVPKMKDSLQYYFEGGFWPISDNITDWVSATTPCVDCRTRGTNSKPDFWP